MSPSRSRCQDQIKRHAKSLLVEAPVCKKMVRDLGAVGEPSVQRLILSEAEKEDWVEVSRAVGLLGNLYIRVICQAHAL